MEDLSGKEIGQSILPVYDCGEADGYTYIVMRYIEGGRTLTDLVRGRPVPLGRA